MKTTYAAIDELYNYIVNVNPALKNAINGQIYKYERPIDSVKEDVVINALPIDNEQLQYGILNLNIFVKDIQQTINGKVNWFLNEEKIQQLAEIAQGMFVNDLWIGQYSFTIQQIVPGDDEEANVGIANFRIEYRSINVTV